MAIAVAPSSGRKGTTVEDEGLAALQETYEGVRESYIAFCDALRVLLVQLVRDAGIETELITARAKEVSSLLEKARARPEYTSLDDVTDKCGVRIITRYQGDVPRVTELISAEFAVRESESHGADQPESFGYVSHHLLVNLSEPRRSLREWKAFGEFVAEIQVRSILQHAWASISHGLDYKTDAHIPSPARRRLFRVAALLETGDELFDGFRDEVDRVRAGYQEEVSKGDWRELTLDLDSIQAAWTELPMQQLVDAALANGWREVEAGPGKVLGDAKPTAEEGQQKVRRLVTVAAALGTETLGQLAELLENIAEDGSELQKLASRGEAQGYVPFAVGPDVAALMLLARRPAPKSIDLKLRFHPALHEIVGLDAPDES